MVRPVDAIDHHRDGLRNGLFRKTSVWAVVLAAVVLGVALVATPASAHGALESTVPADGESVDTAPEWVLLTFNEPVSVLGGGVRVFDEAGRRVDRDDLEATRSNEVRVALRPDVGQGTYAVSWRAMSGDGHPIRGAFLFFVGEADRNDGGLVAQLFDSGGDGTVTAMATGVRAVMYAGLLGAVGLLAFVLAVPGLSTDERDRLVRWARRCAVLAAVTTALGVSLQAAQVTGPGLAQMMDLSLLGDTLASDLGLSSLVRLAALIVVAVAAASRPRVAGGAAGLALGSLLFAGHSVTTEPRAVVVASDAMHLVATSVWLGGLVALGLVLSRRAFDDDPRAAAKIVARFSRLATWTVIAVVVSGAAWGWAEVRALRALTSTAYGWTLLAKVVLVGLVLAAGAYNNRRLVPAITRTTDTNAMNVPVPAGGAVDEVPRSAPSNRAWERLRHIVRFEVAGLAGVVLVTAGLVSLQPAAQEAGITGVFSTYAAIGEDAEVNLVVDPNRVGTNEIRVYLLDDTGRRASFAQHLTLGLSLPSKDIGPIVREPQAVGTGHWVLRGSELSIAGRWEITVTVRVSEFEQLETTIPVTVNP